MGDAGEKLAGHDGGPATPMEALEGATPGINGRTRRLVHRRPQARGCGQDTKLVLDYMGVSVSSIEPNPTLTDTEPSKVRKSKIAY